MSYSIDTIRNADIEKLHLYNVSVFNHFTSFVFFAVFMVSNLMLA